MLIHAASKEYGKNLLHEQEVITNLSDIISNIYITESLLLRAQKMEKNNLKQDIQLYKDICDINMFDTAFLIKKHAIEAVTSLTEEPNKQKMIDAVSKLTDICFANTKNAKRRIADKLIDDNEYKF